MLPNMFLSNSNLIAVLSLLFLAGLLACGSDEPQYREIDLLEHGIALTIVGPDSVDITTGELGDTKDVQVKGGDQYHIQIFASEANTTDVQTVKEELKEAVRENPYFNEIVEDKPDGFIYKTMVDSVNTNYGFRYVVLRGDREIVFQPALVGTFSLDEVKRMYRAVEQK